MRIQVNPLWSETFLIEKSYKAVKSASGADITGPYWMLVECRSSDPLAWWVDGRLCPGRVDRVILYVPPFGWVSEFYRPNTEVKVRGIFSASAPHPHAPRVPCFLEDTLPFPESREALDHFFRNATHGREISVCTRPSGLALRLKRFLDRHYADGVPLSAAAKKFNTSPQYLSREFKKTFSFSPAYYRRGLKVTTATFALLCGKSPTAAAELSGYNDVSRFYKQFSQYMKTTPRTHQCRDVKKRQEKIGSSK